jgi:hypothetical protein
MLGKGVNFPRILQPVTTNDSNRSVSKPNPSAVESVGINAADVGEAQESLFGYMRDHDTNLVHVGSDHYLQGIRIAVRRPFVNNEISQGVGSYLIGVGFDFRAYQVAHPIFKSGRTIGFYKFADQVIHICLSPA